MCNCGHCHLLIRQIVIIILFNASLLAFVNQYEKLFTFFWVFGFQIVIDILLSLLFDAFHSYSADAHSTAQKNPSGNRLFLKVFISWGIFTVIILGGIIMIEGILRGAQKGIWLPVDIPIVVGFSLLHALHLIFLLSRDKEHATRVFYNSFAGIVLLYLMFTGILLEPPPEVILPSFIVLNTIIEIIIKAEIGRPLLFLFPPRF